jgi:hypothetical protein
MEKLLLQFLEGEDFKDALQTLHGNEYSILSMSLYFKNSMQVCFKNSMQVCFKNSMQVCSDSNKSCNEKKLGIISKYLTQANEL